MPVQIPLSKLTVLLNPFEQRVWPTVFDTPMTREEVKSAIDNRLFSPQPHAAVPAGTTIKQLKIMYSREWHIRRVAWLAVHGWPDPIFIDVGVPELQPLSKGHWYVTDGNHRVAAAIYNKQTHIPAIVDGSLDEAYRLFGVDCN